MHFLAVFLYQILQAPKPLHALLKFAVGLVGQLKMAHVAVQCIAVGRVTGRGVLHHADDLPLIDKVHCAA